MNEEEGQNGKCNRNWEDQVVARDANQSTGNEWSGRLSERRGNV